MGYWRFYTAKAYMFFLQRSQFTVVCLKGSVIVALSVLKNDFSTSNPLLTVLIETKGNFCAVVCQCNLSVAYWKHRQQKFQFPLNERHRSTIKNHSRQNARLSKLFKTMNINIWNLRSVRIPTKRSYMYGRNIKTDCTIESLFLGKIEILYRLLSI